MTSPSKSLHWSHATFKCLSGPFKTARGYGTQSGPWHSTLETCFQDTQEDSDCGQSSFINSWHSQRKCHTGSHLPGDFRSHRGKPNMARENAWVHPSQSLQQAVNAMLRESVWPIEGHNKPTAYWNRCEVFWLLTWSFSKTRDLPDHHFFPFYCANNHSTSSGSALTKSYLIDAVAYLFLWIRGMSLLMKKIFKKIWKGEFFQIILTFIKVLTCLPWHPSLEQHVSCTHLSVCTHTHTHSTES